MQNEVTQVDRERAAGCVPATNMLEAYMTRHGERDDSSLIKAFAAHRIAAAKEAEQAVLDGLRNLPDDVVTAVHSAQPFDSVVPSKLIRAIAVSIADALAQEKPDAQSR